MQIAAFHHVNGISGADFRPDWRSLARFGDTASIARYMTDEGFERLVLLEDFVGTGSQMEDAVRFAASLAKQIQVLVCPLIICPDGVRTGRRLEQSFTNVRFSPILELSPGDFLAPASRVDEDEMDTALRELCMRLSVTVQGKGRRPYYTPFGFKKTGGLVVLYTNCPDNSLPIVHHESDSWRPVFPRSSRI